MPNPLIDRYLLIRDAARERSDRGLEREVTFQLARLGYVEPSIEEGSTPEAPRRRGRPPKETTVVALPERAIEE